MIKKGNDYEQTSSYGVSEYKTLPKGGYICRIISAAEELKQGRQYLHVAFDIVEGEYTGYFMDLWRTRKRNNTDAAKEVKFPFEGQMWIPVNEWDDTKKTSRKFKGFCTAVEDSGNEIWGLDGNLDLTRVKDSEVGVIYQRVEDEYNGKTSWKTRPWAFRSISAIASGDYYVPDDKPYEPKNSGGYASDSYPSSFSATDDSVPF